MGYYTRYSLDWDGEGVREADVIAALGQVNEDFKEDIEAYHTEFIGDLFMEELKWYEHREDMIKVSRMFPDAIFTLYGEGEDYSDIWKEYYKNGKMQYAPARIVYPDYDESNMIELFKEN